jgi:hypothetical protein
MLPFEKILPKFDFGTQHNWQTNFLIFDIGSIDIRLINKWRVFGNTDIRVNLKNVKM